MPKGSLSHEACNATTSTPRHEASSKAIAVASSDAGDPSMPTTTGATIDAASAGDSSWMTATGQPARWIIAVLTEPSSTPDSDDLPRRPTTTIWASLDSSSNAGTGAAAIDLV